MGIKGKRKFVYKLSNSRTERLSQLGVKHSRCYKQCDNLGLT